MAHLHPSTLPACPRPLAKKNRGEYSTKVDVVALIFCERWVDLMGFTHSHSESRVLLAPLLSRQPHTEGLSACPLVCLPSLVCLFLFAWYFSDIQVLCRLRAIFGSSSGSSSRSSSSVTDQRKAASD